MTSNAPLLLLTRPQASAERFATDFKARFGPDIRILISPVLRIVPLGQAPDLTGVTGLVFTSAQAVRCFAGQSGKRDLPAFCVGPRTAAAAREAGFAARQAGATVHDLVAALSGQQPGGRLLHLRGTYSRGDLAAALRAAGQPCEEAVIYDQAAQDLSDEALAALNGNDPVLLPLFSPRSAAILGRQAAQARAPLAIAAISRAALEGWGGAAPALTEVSARPDGAGMLDALGALIDACHRLETGPSPI